MALKGRSVRLFLAEGTASGLLTAEIVNWTGHVLSGPRSRLDAALRREELRRTGVYVLSGDAVSGDLPAVYVGEGDDISARLRQHAKMEDKDYWDRFIAVTSKDMNLTKAHVRYLEGRLITLLRAARKSDVRNKTEPGFDKLPEADLSDMETFLDEMQLILPVIGFDLLRRPAITSDAPPDSSLPGRTESIRFVNIHAQKGIHATAFEVDGEFILQSGSTGNFLEAQSFHPSMLTLRAQALESGRMKRLGADNFRLEDNIAFNSASAASVFLYGTSRNGATDWKVEGSQMTYGQWRAARINAAMLSDPADSHQLSDQHLAPPPAAPI